MSKAVLMSIQPKWCEKIANGEKTIEIRKTKPSLQTPFKCYIYETKDKKYEDIGICGHRKDGTPYNFVNHIGKVIGEFVCDRIYTAVPDYNPPMAKFFNYDFYNDRGERLQDCLTSGELSRYGDGAPLYGWHISDLKIYDKPKELSEFYISDSDKRRPSVDCEYKKRGFSHDWCLQTDNRFCNELFCDKKCIKRPPQSWCYVEGLK